MDMHVLATPLRKKNLLPCRFRSVRLHALLQRRFGPCRLHYPSFLPSALGQREAQQETGRQEDGEAPAVAGYFPWLSGLCGSVWVLVIPPSAFFFLLAQK